jgi:hypothetical protein
VSAGVSLASQLSTASSGGPHQFRGGGWPHSSQGYKHISDIHTRLSEVDRKQEEVKRALEAIKAMPTPSAGADGRPTGGQALAHTAAFFLGGIPQLRTLLELGQGADPMEVVSSVMQDIQMYCAVDHIFLADTQAMNRINARAVVIYMRTPFHKQEAMIKLKRFLAHWEVQEATVRDCFPTDMMERARHLASYGAHLRRTEDSARRYQVINRNSEPILQVAGSNGRYVDQGVDEEALKVLIAGQADNRTQREANRGKTGPSHAAKNKRYNKHSSGSSSPMATDEDVAGSAIPAGLANAVPQGSQRKTTNLASANLSRRGRASESELLREAGRLNASSSATASQPIQPQQQPQRQPQPQHQPQQQPQPQPQPLQHQPLQTGGRALAVPQPGDGPRQVAPPQVAANMVVSGHSGISRANGPP